MKLEDEQEVNDMLPDEPDGMQTSNARELRPVTCEHALVMYPVFVIPGNVKSGGEAPVVIDTGITLEVPIEMQVPTTRPVVCVTGLPTAVEQVASL